MKKVKTLKAIAYDVAVVGQAPKAILTFEVIDIVLGIARQDAAIIVLISTEQGAPIRQVRVPFKLGTFKNNFGELKVGFLVENTAALLINTIDEFNRQAEENNNPDGIVFYGLRATEMIVFEAENVQG